MEQLKNILITGGSGLVGGAITKLLEANGFQVAWLSRNPEKQTQKSFAWDITLQSMDKESLEWADAVVHLAGEGVAEEKWTEERKKAILNSRTQSTKLLFDYCKNSALPPKAFISASAIGYYGMDTGDQLLEENAASGKDFLSEVVAAWEKEVNQFYELGMRTVLLRIGIVLDAQGGALKEMLKPPVAAPLGNGKQWMSWIQIADLAGIFMYALQNENLTGIYNAVAPNPATNRDVTKAAAKAKGKLYMGIGVPPFALELVLGEMAQMVLGGNKVSSKKIELAGYHFSYPQLKEAMDKTFEKR
jgi:uncharacterized protein